MSTQKRDYPNILIVEGQDDKFAVIGLMKHHVNWPNESNKWPVWVEAGNGAEDILAAGYLTAEIKASNVKRLGVMLDADTHAGGRYERIQQLCLKLFANLPAELPPDGLVVENEDKRFGLWVMPDNSSPGDLETFLKYLIPSGQEVIWTLACESVTEAVKGGAGCKDVHLPKARLYTWLAWQDAPGQSPGVALSKKLLDPHSAESASFVGWFKRLYEL